MRVIFFFAILLIAVSKAYAQIDPAKDTTIYFRNCEDVPKFKGGIQKFQRLFIAAQTQDTAWHNNEKNYAAGYISFIIEKDGRVHNIDLGLRGDEIETYFKERALVAFKKIKGWKPGRIYNKPVRSRHWIEVDLLTSKKLESEIFSSSETLPQPKVGYSEFYKYIKKNRNKIVGVSGWIFVNFIVERDGSLSALSVKNSNNEQANIEAIRLLKEAGMWRPGIQSGRPVRVMLSVPVSFD